MLKKVCGCTAINRNKKMMRWRHINFQEQAKIKKLNLEKNNGKLGNLHKSKKGTKRDDDKVKNRSARRIWGKKLRDIAKAIKSYSLEF